MIGSLRRALPPGTFAVAVGIVILGAASYVHLAVAGHALDAEGMAQVSVMWTVVMSIGVGLFLPVEQELTRIVAARATHGQGVGPVLRRAAVLTAAILGLVLVVIAAAAKPVAEALFDGDAAMVVGLGGAFIGMAVCYLSRGILAGLGLFRPYSLQLALDGGLRIVMALALGIAGVDHPLPYALILAAAPVLATLATLLPVIAAAAHGPQIAWPQLCRGLGLLICSTLLSQLVVNVAVVSTKLIAPDDAALIGALLAAIVLARVPLFVFASLQTSLLKGLADEAAAGRHQAFRAMLTRACVVVVALGVLGGIPATVLGPWLIRVGFGAEDVLGHGDFLWFSAGTMCFMLAMVLGQAAMTLNRHGAQLAAWLLGTAVLAGVTMAPGSVQLRVEAAYTVGSSAVALVLAVVLFGRRSLRGEPASAVRASVASGTGH